MINMHKILSALLLLTLLLLPIALVVGFSYSGAAHPAEDRIIENDSFLNESVNDVEIIFFGFAGCNVVCPASLAKLSSILDSPTIKNNGADVGGMFIEVKSMQEYTKRNISELYTAGFSQNIKGYTPDIESYRKLSEEFIIKLYNGGSGNSQISHTDHFFLLTREHDQWVIQRVLDNNSSKAQMIEIISNTITRS